MKRNCMKTNLKKFLAGTLGVLVLLSSSSIVEAATSDQVPLSEKKPGAGYVNTASSDLRVREAPSTSSKVVASLPKDTIVMIVERCGDFDKVQYDKYGHYGYVASQYIREYDLEYYCVTHTSSGTVNLRSGRGTSYEVLASIPSGIGLPIMTDVPNWPYVLYGIQFGYVSADYVTKWHY